MNEDRYVNTSSITAMIGAILLLGGMAGCTFFHQLHQCGVAECPTDAKITADVEARFQQHTSTQPPNTIYVSTFKGVVYLSGDVESPAAKQEAELVARQTPGVTDVVNSIVGRQSP
jgi:osmotically-inducible protein OsmY